MSPYLMNATNVRFPPVIRAKRTSVVAWRSVATYEYARPSPPELGVVGESDHCFATSSLSAGHRIRRRGFEDVVQPSATRFAIPRGPRYLRPLRRERWNRSASRQWIFRGIVASYAHHPVNPPEVKKNVSESTMPIATSIARSQA
jgi:hypothetical protein